MCVATKLGATMYMGPAPEDVVASINQAMRINRLGAEANIDWILAAEAEGQMQPVGYMSLLQRPYGRAIDVAVLPGHRQQGYGAAAVNCGVCAAFTEGGLGLSALYADVGAYNFPSIKNLERAGFYAARQLIGGPRGRDDVLSLEQVNPYDPAWTGEWARVPSSRMPDYATLQARRAKSRAVLADTVMHFCARADCANRAM